MDKQRWTTILRRIARHDVDDLDDLTGRFDVRATVPGRDVFPRIDAVLRPNVKFKRADAVCVGLRAPVELADAADRAMRLATFAIERDVEVIVLVQSGNSGLEQFGFRTERVAGDTQAERDRCEDQILRFWNIDLVL